MAFLQTSPTITSRTNARVKQLRAAFAGHAKLSGGLVAIEGEHLLFEAMRSGLAFKTIFVSERRPVPEWTPRSVEVLQLTEEVFRSVVDTQAPQGLAALLVPPTWEIAEVMVGTPLVLIAAGLQDPGNLGTLIRSAEAFDAAGVLTTAGTVSEWNQKVVRASAGSVFRVPVVPVDGVKLAGLKAQGLRLLAAVAGEATAAAKADLSGACGLMIGNEGAGLAEEFERLADAHITIPCPGKVESLNAAVAGSLLLYEASRQRVKVQAR